MKKTMLAIVAAAALAAPAAAAAPSPTRTLRVDRPSRAGAARATVVHVVRGRMPAHRTTARVLTDTRCQPDARGVSHCLNKMRLANGAVIVARHDHRMMDMPCLDPGERVVVRPAV